MWGMVCRLADGRVDAHIPGWLLGGIAGYQAADYLGRCARALAADPAAHGWDPAQEAAVFVQTWDCARAPVASLAFGRRRVGHEAVGLIPDPYFIGQDGYRDLRALAPALPRWRDRSATLLWRGSVTGDGPFASSEEIPRIRLALACRAVAGTDARLIGVHETMAFARPTGEIDACIARHGLGGAALPMAEFGRHRWVIDIDGFASAWGLLEKLILGCCVLKVASAYEQWFYHRLRPWIHYVPLAADLSDLAARVDWCRANPDTCEWIARNGQLAAGAVTVEETLRESCRALMQAARFTPR